jgi:uncharacterized membrane protein YfcA
MLLEPIQYLLSLVSGGLVGFTLGLFGGGGSILAVPLMVYLVGVSNPHLAIGTSALAVAANAGANLVSHARHGNIKWRCAAIYSLAGVAGAFLGGRDLHGLAIGIRLSSLGKRGRRLCRMSSFWVPGGTIITMSREKSCTPTCLWFIQFAPLT